LFWAWALNETINARATTATTNVNFFILKLRNVMEISEIFAPFRERISQ
jgi:hypothetical protein